MCIYICVPKCNLFRPYKVTCMCVFRADCLTLDLQVVCFSLGKITSLVPRSLPSLIVPYVRLRPCGPPSFANFSSSLLLFECLPNAIVYGNIKLSF